LAQAHKILVNALALACQICLQARDRAQYERSVAVRAAVRRDGTETGTPVEDVVSGDVVDAAANLVPADGIVLASGAAAHTNEPLLSGEPTESRNEPAIV
jgi:magnesium-transporting ATPase (P-type)